MTSPDKITFGTYELLEPYMDAHQKEHAAHAADKSRPRWPCVRSLIHNDGPDIRARFILNGRGSALQVDIPIDKFNELPVWERGVTDAD